VSLRSGATLIRPDDQVVYADAGYQGVVDRDEIVGSQHLAGVDFRATAKKSKIAAMPSWTSEWLTSLQ